jgi:hypothetical protein
VWTKWAMHVKFTNTQTGFFEVFSDVPNGAGGSLKQVVNLHNRPTLFTTPHCGKPDNASTRIGLYRNVKNTGNVWVANDSYTVGTTREIVEAEAF